MSVPGRATGTVDGRAGAAPPADPQLAVQEAAVAAAEAIAAEAAAAVATEAAATAEAAVTSASAAAAKAAVRVSRTAAGAVSVAAATAAETAMQNALDADDDVDTATATAVASVAVSLALEGSYGVVDDADAPDASSWDGDVADAVATSTAASAMAAAKVAVAVAAAAAAAATAAIDAATLIEGQLGRNVAAAATAVGQAISAHAAEVARAALQSTGEPEHGAGSAPAPLDPAGLDGPGPDRTGMDAVVRTEWAAALADPVMPTFTPYEEPPGTVVSLAAPAERGLWRDISLARRMEGMLRESEAHFEAAFDNAPTAMLVAALEAGRPARFLRVNRALSLLTGFPAAELLDLGFADLADPETCPVEDVAGGPPGDDEPYERVCRWLRADGRGIWVQIRMAPVRTGGEQPGQLVCQVEDVTARRTADSALRSSEARFRLAFTGAPRAAVLVELGGHQPGRLFAANSAACAMFGRSEIEMLWLDLGALISPADRPAVRDLLERMCAGEVTHHEQEHRYQTLEGDIGWLVLTVHVVAGVDGRPEHALAYLRDEREPAGATGPAAGAVRPARAGTGGGALPPPPPELRGIETVEQAACLLVRVVHSLGGTCVPARLAPSDALPLDISLGEGEALLPVAPPGSAAREALEAGLPPLLEDLPMLLRRAR